MDKCDVYMSRMFGLWVYIFVSVGRITHVYVVRMYEFVSMRCICSRERVGAVCA